MGLQVKTTLPPVGLEVQVATQRALLRAGETILAAAVEGAPYEDEARHGVHLRDTGYTRLASQGVDDERVAVGFDAYWALWQEQRMDYHHEHGHAKFLELALAQGGEAALEQVAAAIRAALA